jgi:hypothetical protein
MVEERVAMVMKSAKAGTLVRRVVGTTSDIAIGGPVARQHESMSPQSLGLAAVSATPLAARVMACPLAFPAADMACCRPRLGKFSHGKRA